MTTLEVLKCARELITPEEAWIQGGETVESKSRWDFVTCGCGKLSVDGGRHYIKRATDGSPDAQFEELSEYGECAA